MSKNKAQRTDSEQLSSIPIETLNLSDNAIHVLKSVSIQSVADCIYAIELWRATLIAPQPGVNVMVTEVLPKLKELGYWTEDD